MSTKDKKKKTSKLCKLLEIAGIDGEGGVSIRRPDLLNDLVWIFPKIYLSNNLVYFKF